MSSSTSGSRGYRSRQARRRGRILFLSALAVLAVPDLGTAQDTDAPEADPESPLTRNATAASAFDPHDPSVPDGAVRAFIDACRRGDYDEAALHLDLTHLPQDLRGIEGPRLARQLKTVLDQKLWLQFERISDRSGGDLDDGLPADLERLGTISDGFDVDVLIRRVEDEDGRRVWKFATGTVEAIPSLYREFGYGAIGELLPGWMFEVSFLEIRFVQWIGLAVLVAVAWIVARVLVALIRKGIRPIAMRTTSDFDDRLLKLLAAPSRLLVGLAVFALGTHALRLAAPVYEFLSSVEIGLGLVGITWISLRMVDVGSDLLATRFDRAGNVSAKAVIPSVRRAVKVIAFLIAGIALLQNLGFNVTGLIAGLGVGGLALALAAQKSVENLFGGVSLILDRPVRPGDFCRFGDGNLGTVEEIGLRSTRVRTLDRTVITVPNSAFAEFALENFAPRDRVRLLTQVGLRYETTADQLRCILAALREVLIGHPRVVDAPLRVRFCGFGAHSLDLEILAYVETTDFGEFCAIREDLFLRFMDVIEDNGSAVAFPSQTLYLGRDHGLDPERREMAEKTVRGWREDGQLPFPDFSPQTTSELRDRLDYPPNGSATLGG